MKNDILFSATNKKYFASEIVSYVAAAAAASASAAIADSITDSNMAITIISTICGSIGFFGGGMGTYAALNTAEYKKGKRNFSSDMKSMFLSNTYGIWATYMFRIPFQYLLQKFAVAPAVAAPIAQIVAGQAGTVVRLYSNYKRKIFSINSQDEKN
jgi:hypothetical protein